MALRDQTYLRVVLYEGNDAQPLESEQRFQTLSRLLGQGYAVTRVTGTGRTAPADDVPALVLGRFADGVEQLGSDRVSVTNVSGFSDDQVVAVVETVRTEKKAVQH